MQNLKLEKLPKKPFVSVCTPTFNRRPFIPIMIQCFENQKYPKDKIEWIIIDDGDDKIEDLVSHIPQVKYFKYDEKIIDVILNSEQMNKVYKKNAGKLQENIKHPKELICNLNSLFLNDGFIKLHD